MVVQEGLGPYRLVHLAAEYAFRRVAGRGRLPDTPRARQSGRTHGAWDG